MTEHLGVVRHSSAQWPVFPQRLQMVFFISLSVSLHWWLPLSVTLASPLFSLHLMMVIAVRADLSSLSHGLQHLGWVPLCMLHDLLHEAFLLLDVGGVVAVLVGPCS